jgi:hypothetical protein
MFHGRSARSALLRSLISTPFIYTLFLLVSACGTESDDYTSIQSSDAAPESTLFIVMGGNNTCARANNSEGVTPLKSSLYESFVAKVLNRAHANFNYFVTCYKDAESTIYYTRSEDLTVVESADLSEFSSLMTSLQADMQKIYMIGHSYGGWLAMKLGQKFAREFDQEMIAGLYTVDPISREYCSWGSPFGCQDAPQDFNANERRKLNEVSGKWINFYQTQTWYLHSAAMKEADENVKVGTSHTDIDQSDAVWSRVNANLNVNLQASL